jgi:hypothetical protein
MQSGKSFDSSERELMSKLFPHKEISVLDALWNKEKYNKERAESMIKARDHFRQKYPGYKVIVWFLGNGHDWAYDVSGLVDVRLHDGFTREAQGYTLEHRVIVFKSGTFTKGGHGGAQNIQCSPGDNTNDDTRLKDTEVTKITVTYS